MWLHYFVHVQSAKLNTEYCDISQLILLWHSIDSTVINWLYIYINVLSEQTTVWASYRSLHATSVFPLNPSVHLVPWNISRHCNTFWKKKKFNTCRSITPWVSHKSKQSECLDSKYTDFISSEQWHTAVYAFLFERFCRIMAKKRFLKYDF